jgi:predicted RNase H-like nuclease (RuvC/YqgF family)
MNSLYDEIRVIREQLLNRIELLEDEVDYLTQENMYYSKQLYQLESDIDSLLARITQKSANEGLEYQESSEEINTES